MSNLKPRDYIPSSSSSSSSSAPAELSPVKDVIDGDEGFDEAPPASSCEDDYYTRKGPLSIRKGKGEDEYVFSLGKYSSSTCGLNTAKSLYNFCSQRVHDSEGKYMDQLQDVCEFKDEEKQSFSKCKTNMLGVLKNNYLNNQSDLYYDLGDSYRMKRKSDYAFKKEAQQILTEKPVASEELEKMKVPVEADKPPAPQIKPPGSTEAQIPRVSEEIVERCITKKMGEFYNEDMLVGKILEKLNGATPNPRTEPVQPKVQFAAVPPAAPPQPLSYYNILAKNSSYRRR